MAVLAGCNVQATTTPPVRSPRVIGGEVLRTAVESDQARLNKQIDAEIQARGGKPDDVRAAAIKADLGEALPTGSVTTCGATLCRLETNHANEATYRDFVRKTFIGFAAPWQGPFTVATVPPPSNEPKGAPVKSVIFLLGENNKRKIPLPVNDDCGGCANAGQTRPGGLSSVGPREESAPPAPAPTRKP
jgi:hypothetical protein